MSHAFYSNDFLSICLQSNSFVHIWCQMHFKVMISLAFAFKVTKVSPMPDRNTCKLPFCSNLKAGGSTASSCSCHYMSLPGGFQLPAVTHSTATRCQTAGVELARVCENPRSYVRTYFIDNLFPSHLQTTSINKFISSSPVYLT